MPKSICICEGDRVKKIYETSEENVRMYNFNKSESK